MKVIAQFIVLTLFATYSIAQNSLDNAIESFRNGQGLEHASISFNVIDLETGKQISQYNAITSLPTASTAKLFSTATALDILGPNYRAKTRIYAEGSIDTTGTLKGNIWIRGGGDPSLGSKYFNKEGHQLDFMSDWADSLIEKGITSITGNIIADASEFGYDGAPGGWNWVDLGNYYGAGPSGLTLYDNLIKFRFSCPSSIGKTTTIKSIDPFVPGMEFHNYIKSSERKGDNAYLYGGPYATDRFGTGTLPAGATNFLVKGSLPDPEFQFAFELHRILKEKGIDVKGEAKSARRMDISSKSGDYENRNLILSHEGVRLIQIIEKTNMRSVNLFAEHMLNLVGYEKKQNGSTQKGLQTLAAHWKSRINTSGLSVTDGSGLSRTNGISAEHFTSLLKYMYTSKYSKQYLKSLPVAGVSGTMRNVCKSQNAHNKIKAKSGSMSRIKSYSGYVETINGKNLAFALIVNNADCSSSILKRRMEILFNKMVAYQ